MCFLAINLTIPGIRLLKAAKLTPESTVPTLELCIPGVAPEGGVVMKAYVSQV